MKQDAPKARKAKTYLSETDKWNIAKYCIEHKCVVLDKDGRFLRFRMAIRSICEELNPNWVGNSPLKEWAVKSSMEFYNTVLDLTGKMPDVPVQDTVQDDILKAENAKLSKRVEDLKKAVQTMIMLVSNTQGDLARKCSTLSEKLGLQQ